MDTFSIFDLVDLVLEESSMQSQLERGGVVRMDHGMHVEREWHARVAQIPDPIERFQPPLTVDHSTVVVFRPRMINLISTNVTQQLARPCAPSAAILKAGQIPPP
jgi:hypothetical protein